MSSVKRATIHEVAAHAGVSHQTVSRFLRGNGGLKPATLAKVEAAVAELDYRPNLIARSMRTRRTGRLAVLLPAATIALPLRLLSAATTVAHRAGYAIDILSLEGPAADRFARARELADSSEFEGILALATFGEHDFGSETHVVIVSNYDDEMRGIGALADGAACGAVVQRLVELGHTSFLHLAGPQSFASARNRRRTFVDSTNRLGVHAEIIEDDWTGHAGYRSIMALPVDTPVTAVVAGNDAVAMGAIRALQDRGWKVPRDASVFGWDDYDFCRFTSPSLSTVAIDRERQGVEAMTRLIALIRGTEPPPVDQTSLHTVVERESIGPPPERRRRLRRPSAAAP